MGKKLTLTFKNSEEWIYQEVMKHSGKGNWIKDVLSKEIREEKKEKLQPIQDDFGILGDFKK